MNRKKLVVAVVALILVEFLLLGFFFTDGLLFAYVERNARPLLANVFPGLKAATEVPSLREDPLWLKLHQRLKERAAQGPFELIFVGDSITEQMEGQHDLLESLWGPCRTAVFGIGGDTTQLLLGRIKDGELSAARPKVIVMLIGVNNIRSDFDEDIVRGIRANVAALRQEFPQSKLLVLGITPATPGANYPARARIKNINRAVAALLDGSDVSFVDVGEQLLEPDGSISAETMPDYLHFSAKGYRRLFAALKPHVDRLLPSCGGH